MFHHLLDIKEHWQVAKFAPQNLPPQSSHKHKKKSKLLKIFKNKYHEGYEHKVWVQFGVESGSPMYY